MYGGKSPRAVVLKCDDENWHELFKIMSSACRAIIIVPQTSEGVKEELKYICKNQLHTKTIIVMPPIKRFGRSKEIWTSIIHKLNDEGFALPEYDKGGSVFIPDLNLSPAHTANFTDVWNEKLMVRNSIVKLLEKIPLKNEPLDQVMKKVLDLKLIHNELR